ncbi:hypothetical protein [Ralstonia sp. GP101]
MKVVATAAKQKGLACANPLENTGGESGTRKIAVEHFNRNYVSP